MPKNLYGSDTGLIDAGMIYDQTEERTQDAINQDLMQAYRSAATEATGLLLLEEERLNTVFEGGVLDILGKYITNLPQDETLNEVVDELVQENSWMAQIYREVAEAME